MDEICNECADCTITYSDETAEETDYTTEDDTDAEGEGKWALKGRLKSWAVWTAIIGLVSVICSAFGVWDALGIDSDAFDGIATAIGSVLTAFGILNNPTSTDSF